MSDQDDSPPQDEKNEEPQSPASGSENSGADTAEQQPEVNPFEQAGRNPLGGSGGTGGAGTAHAARRTFAPGRAERTYEIRGDGQVFEGNYFIGQFGPDSSPPVVQGSVPQEALKHLADVYCEASGYHRMKQLLRTDGLLVLCGESGSGRKATALALLSELADNQVTRLDPSHAVHEISEQMIEAGAGHLLELPPDDGRREPERRRGETHTEPRGPAASPSSTSTGSANCCASPMRTEWCWSRAETWPTGCSAAATACTARPHLPKRCSTVICGCC